MANTRNHELVTPEDVAAGDDRIVGEHLASCVGCWEEAAETRADAGDGEESDEGLDDEEIERLTERRLYLGGED